MADSSAIPNSFTSPITGATRVLGVIADPVVQARAPGMANALLAQRGHASRHVLVAMQVGPAGLAQTVAALRGWRNFDGAVVSMPHKMTICALLDELTPEARMVGAVNVVRRREDGSLLGTVMDGAGFVGGLLRAGHEVRGKHCLLAGAGGAASAIAIALAQHGCASLTLLNRTVEKAEALATRVKAAYPQAVLHVGSSAGARYDIAINATSLGMKPGDALPFSLAQIDASSLVAECVIAPEITALLETARGRGRAIHTGPPMLAAQIEMMLAFMGAA